MVLLLKRKVIYINIAGLLNKLTFKNHSANNYVVLIFFRSRSHAARQKGIEVSPDADDGLSDQDVDPELSNSSSEMVNMRLQLFFN